MANLAYLDFLDVLSSVQSTCRFVEQCKNDNPIFCGCFQDYLRDNGLPSIGNVACICSCGWRGTVYDCEPDVDGDGSLGCPECLKVIETEYDKIASQKGQ